MNKIFFNASARYLNTGLLFLRIAIGGAMIYFHGYNKIVHHENWVKLGGAMNSIGVDFAPGFWGFMSAFAEFFGSVFLILGLFTKPAALLLGFTMFIAAYVNYSGGKDYFAALDLMIVCIFFLFCGAGKFSIDAKISGFKK